MALFISLIKMLNISYYVIIKFIKNMEEVFIMNLLKKLFQKIKYP